MAILERKLFWDQSAEDRGDNPYFPEFLDPRQPWDWKTLRVPNCWFVYILYTERVRNPLYVGMTGTVELRLAQHRRSKAWWPLVDSITVDSCDSRDDALELEDRRIYHMKPLFNVVSNQHTREAK